MGDWNYDYIFGPQVMPGSRQITPPTSTLPPAPPTYEDDPLRQPGWDEGLEGSVSGGATAGISGLIGGAANASPSLGSASYGSLAPLPDSAPHENRSWAEYSTDPARSPQLQQWSREALQQAGQAVPPAPGAAIPPKPAPAAPVAPTPALAGGSGVMPDSPQIRPEGDSDLAVGLGAAHQVEHGGWHEYAPGISYQDSGAGMNSMQRQSELARALPGLQARAYGGSGTLGEPSPEWGGLGGRTGEVGTRLTGGGLPAPTADRPVPEFSYSTLGGGPAITQGSMAANAQGHAMVDAAFNPAIDRAAADQQAYEAKRMHERQMDIDAQKLGFKQQEALLPMHEAQETQRALVAIEGQIRENFDEAQKDPSPANQAKYMAREKFLVDQYKRAQERRNMYEASIAGKTSWRNPTKDDDLLGGGGMGLGAGQTPPGSTRPQ